MSERDLLAAEYVLGVLEGEALLDARGLIATDPGFARAVDDWHERLAPLFDEIGEHRPPDAAWARIRSTIATAPTDNVVALKRQLGLWRGLSAAATAVAASMALVVAYDATRAPPAVVSPGGAPVMVATLMSDDSQMLLSAAWRPEDRSLTLMPGGMTASPGHSHELWIIPADGKPRSLGLVSTKAGRMPVSPAMAPHFSGAATLALSVEPEGGSPGDGPSGPVVAAGELQKV